MDQTPSQPMSTSNQPVPQKGNKMILWLVGGLVVIIVLVGAIYFYLGNQKKADQPLPSPTATQNTDTVSTLENDLNSVSVEQQDNFSTIDQDLKQL